MKGLIASTTLILSASFCYATGPINIPQQQQTPQPSVESIVTTCNDTGLTLFQKDELGRRGCCSWHGGVCGCQNGRVVCCDDTYSPSCDCKHEDRPVEPARTRN